MLAVEPRDLGRRWALDMAVFDRDRSGSAVPGRLCGCVCDMTVEP
jgi:hypothetical protein